MCLAKNTVILIITYNKKQYCNPYNSTVQKERLLSCCSSIMYKVQVLETQFPTSSFLLTEKGWISNEWTYDPFCMLRTQSFKVMGVRLGRR